MKVLLDACVWGGATSALSSAGHDVDWVGGWSADPGDEGILAMASARGQVLVTLDKDFGELAVVHRRQHCGIVRLVNLSARSQGHACAAVLRRYGEELARGAIGDGGPPARTDPTTGDRARMRTTPRRRSTAEPIR